LGKIETKLEKNQNPTATKHSVFYGCSKKVRNWVYWNLES